MKEDLVQIGVLVRRIIGRAKAVTRPWWEPAVAVTYLLIALTIATPGVPMPWTSILGIAVSMGTARLYPRVSMGCAGGAILAQMLFLNPQLTVDNKWVFFGLLFTCGAFANRSINDETSNIVRHSRTLWFSLAVTVFAHFSFAFPIYGQGKSLQTRWSVLYFGRLVDGVVATHIWSMIGALCVTLLAWLVGFAFRVRRERGIEAERRKTVEAQLRDAELEIALTNERDRIAQDVHDIMAHSLSVIVAQADGARMLRPTRPEAVDESLTEIAASARTSLTEVRMLIESLVNAPDGHSHPTLDNLDELIERMTGAGLSIERTVHGDRRELTPTQQLAVYRIVQEGLTNALKHSGGSPHARLTFEWRGDGLALTIESCGDGSRVAQGDATSEADSASERGRGLYGMRERARLAGGWLTSGLDEQTGSYLVTLFVPQLQPAAPAVSGMTSFDGANAPTDAVIEGNASLLEPEPVLHDSSVASDHRMLRND